MILETIVNNTEKCIPECPTITYEVVGDMGEDGTKTIYECGSYPEAQGIISAIRDNNLDIPNMDLYEDELENLKGVSINIILNTTEFDIVTYGDEKRISSLLTSYKVQSKSVLDVACEAYSKLSPNDMAEYTCTAIASLQSVGEKLDLTKTKDIQKVKHFILETLLVNEINEGFRDRTTGELL